jgi:tRNA pseudouridine38-40 synthase
VVENCLRSLGWQGKSILAAGRTDSGVHASGQVIAFDLDWNHPVDELHNALNALLPQDISAREVHMAEAGFHPRYAALARTYRYRIYSQAVRDPLVEPFAWRVWPAPDLQALQRATGRILGWHDFAAFGSPLRKGGSTLRTVLRAEWAEDGDRLAFEICADAFLYRMVRRLVFALVQVGLGRLDEAEITRCLDDPASSAIQGLAPPQGLTLLRVDYPLSGKND